MPAYTANCAHRAILRQSRLLAAGRLQDIENEIATLLEAFPDLPVTPACRAHTRRRPGRLVPVRSGSVRQQLH